jgi:hypothetical protein
MFCHGCVVPCFYTRALGAFDRSTSKLNFGGNVRDLHPHFLIVGNA